MSTLHRLTLRSPGAQRVLVLEPWGEELDLGPGDDAFVELTGVHAPELDVEADRITIWAGAGAELRVVMRGLEVFTSFGNPVPDVPPDMTVRGFLRRMLGTDDPD